MQTANFGFLQVHDAKLVQFCTLAERYFQGDPVTCLFKLRQYAELLAKLVAAHHAVYLDERESFEETLRHLSFGLAWAEIEAAGSGYDMQLARNLLAKRIIDAIQEHGERDPKRLKAYALEGFEP